MNKSVPPPETASYHLVHRGSVKLIYEDLTEPNTLDFWHGDTVSMFDHGPHQTELPGVGESLCACTAATFALAGAIGVPTHFVRKIDSRTIRVKRFSTDAGGSGANRRIDLEIIDRDIAAGSLCRDWVRGKKDPRDFGFPDKTPPREGTRLKWPVHQITTKVEDIDRPLSSKEALKIGRIEPEHLERIWSLTDKLNGAIALAALRAGFTRLDGKKEYGIGVNGEIILLDSAGTPYEDRFARSEELQNGVVVHHSKEYLRQIFIDNGYFALLEAARTEGKSEPDYPDFEPKQIQEVTRRFTVFAEKYTAAVGIILN